MHWQVIVFGWPGASLCLAVTAAGLFFRRPIMLAVAGCFGLGFTAYVFMAGWPIAVLSITAQVCAFLALRANRPALAYLMAVPTMALMAVPVGLAIR